MGTNFQQDVITARIFSQTRGQNVQPTSIFNFHACDSSLRDWLMASSLYLIFNFNCKIEVFRSGWTDSYKSLTSPIRIGSSNGSAMSGVTFSQIQAGGHRRIEFLNSEVGLIQQWLNQFSTNLTDKITLFVWTIRIVRNETESKE